MRPVKNELIPTRASLLLRLKDWQDQESWQDFFNTYWRLIYGVARKAGLSDMEAQDVVQETLFSVAKSIPAFKYDPSIGSFKGWLLNLTRWRIISQFRKRRSLAKVQPRTGHPNRGTDFLENMADPSAKSIDSVWEEEWKSNLLQAAIEKAKRRIDPEKYQIFDCYVNKEWPAEKVASSFKVSVEQVYQVKHRVTQTIKAEAERLEKQIT